MAEQLRAAGIDTVEAMASVTAWGAQPLNRSSTSGRPDSRKPKHTTTVMMKAMTWLRVVAEMQAPKGLIVGAVARGERVFVPRGKDRLEAGDVVILFVQAAHVPTVNLLFPSREPSGLHPARQKAGARRQKS